MSVPGGTVINAAKDFGFHGAGTAEDTERLNDAIRAAFVSGSVVEVPAGTCYLQHPISICSDTHLRCAVGFANGNGTGFRPSPDFDLAYNGNGVRPALFQSVLNTDPTGAGRWNFWQDYYGHGTILENVYVQNAPDGQVKDGYPVNPIAGLDGFALYQPADNSSLINCRATGFATGFHVYGMCAPLTTYGCTAFGNNDWAWKLESLHDVFPTMFAGGCVNMFAGGGDNNSPGWIYAAGAHRGLVCSPKLEYIRNYTDTILTVDASKECLGTGKPDRSRWTLLSVGAEFNAGLVKSAPWVESLVKIQHTGTEVATEFPLPVIHISGGQFWGGIDSILWDQGFNRRFKLSMSGKGEPGTEFLYAAGGVEKTVRYVQGGHQFLGGPVELATFTLATLPDPSLTPGMAFLANVVKSNLIAIAGPGVPPARVPIFSDGFHWRRMDNTIVQ